MRARWHALALLSAQRGRANGALRVWQARLCRLCVAVGLGLGCGCWHALALPSARRGDASGALRMWQARLFDSSVSLSRLEAACCESRNGCRTMGAGTRRRCC